MQENQILDLIDAFSLNKISDHEKAILLADIKDELNNKKFASNMNKIVLSKINDLSEGFYKESQFLYPQAFADINEIENYPKGSDVINKSEIDQFLDKISSETFEGHFFNDTFDSYHPERNMRADGLPRHRSDFNIKS